jgi:hypothetical protein
MNYVRTVLWMLFAVVATYTAAEGTLAYKKTVEQDGAGAGKEVDSHSSPDPVARQQASDAAPPIQPIDVDAAYEATIRKHVDNHMDGVHRLELEMQRIERHMKVLHDLKADQDRRLEMADGS